MTVINTIYLTIQRKKNQQIIYIIWLLLPTKCDIMYIDDYNIYLMRSGQELNLFFSVEELKRADTGETYVCDKRGRRHTMGRNPMTSATKPSSSPFPRWPSLPFTLFLFLSLSLSHTYIHTLVLSVSHREATDRLKTSKFGY